MSGSLSGWDKPTRKDFAPVLVDGENLVWSGRPVRASFILPPTALVVLGLLWACFDGFIVSTIVRHSRQVPWEFLGPFFALHGLPVWILLLWPFYRWMAWRNTAYAITDRRFLIRDGVIGTDYQSLEFDRLQGVDVEVDLGGKLFGTGDVKLTEAYTARRKIGPTFWAVADPYAVAKVAKQVSLDVKSDILYPNALRPEDNPGYRSRYGSKEQR